MTEEQLNKLSHQADRKMAKEYFRGVPIDDICRRYGCHRQRLLEVAMNYLRGGLELKRAGRIKSMAPQTTKRGHKKVVEPVEYPYTRYHEPQERVRHKRYNPPALTIREDTIEDLTANQLVAIEQWLSTETGIRSAQMVLLSLLDRLSVRSHSILEKYTKDRTPEEYLKSVFLSSSWSWQKLRNCGKKSAEELSLFARLFQHRLWQTMNSGFTEMARGVNCSSII